MHPIDSGYDYIVLGGGTAGCVLAARLSESEQARVLLIERGRTMPIESREPARWLSLSEGPLTWPGGTVVQASTGTSVPWARGLGLGGSSGINGMVHIRGHRSSYDEWPGAGAKGWGFDDLLPFFRASETAPHRDPALRGQHGPMTVAPVADPHPVALATLAAATEVGHPLADDISGGLEVGFGLPDLAIVDGHRLGAADAYLTPVLGRPTLNVATNALVHRVIVRNGRAVGVEFSIGDELLTVSCSQEVVLAAGAVGSPEILLRSGIGPSDHLRELGIDTVVDLPGVGEDLHDHPISAMVHRAADPLPDSTGNHTEVLGLLASDGGAVPDLHLLVLSRPDAPQGPTQGFVIAVGLMTPHSRGTLRLSSSDPTTHPLLDPRYLADDRDRAAMLAGLRLAREVAASPAFQPLDTAEIAPGEIPLDQYLKASLGTYYHYVGTCRIGTDDLAVVDTDLTVHGVAGLRVADASVMPSIPSANTNATVLAIAERAAALIAGRP
ncbi:GMC family oxidoreductase [Kutzneria chonburiensis]|uniref:GMC family oxidoreductase n=1 Tax=Kutzneria chonburiensis TaxID=1483604 RepID=A0ABV6N7Y2_9PSEU|nr:GMC family oxidoreductase N-terminal domain-containing protein [Kutzneria chonburiensis]